MSYWRKKIEEGEEISCRAQQVRIVYVAKWRERERRHRPRRRDHGSLCFRYTRRGISPSNSGPGSYKSFECGCVRKRSRTLGVWTRARARSDSPWARASRNGLVCWRWNTQPRALPNSHRKIGPCLRRLRLRRPTRCRPGAEHSGPAYCYWGAIGMHSRCLPTYVSTSGRYHCCGRPRLHGASNDTFARAKSCVCRLGNWAHTAFPGYRL
jgi:hypothetical protein